MSKFINERYRNLDAYTPGEQPKDMKYIKLNTNESPYAPSPGVKACFTETEIDNLRLYPDPECTFLRKSIASLYGVGYDNIFISNGSDEILNFSFLAFFGKDKPCVFPDITYGFYKVYAELYGVEYTKIPLDENFRINTDDYTGIGKNIVIANPNAPTGLILSVEDIEKILKSNPDNLVIIDEAYIDFGGKSCYNLIDKYDNLLVVRTYSKSRSMAGARLGFAIASKEIIADLEKIKYSTNPYNINRLSMLAAQKAIDDNQYYADNCQKIIKTRSLTAKALADMGFECTDSMANFIFAKHPCFDGQFLYERLKSKGILVRHFNSPRISDYLRITVGTPEEMNALTDALKDIMNK